MTFKDAVISAENNFCTYRDYLDVILIAHVLEPRGSDNIMQLNCSEAEHFTIQEFNEIYQGIVNGGFFIKNIFFNELDFIKNIILDPSVYTNSIVFNLCRNGIKMNNKTIIPSICNLLGIPFTSASAGSCALARNKLLFTSYLNANGIPCPITGCHADDFKNRITQDSTVICKPIDSSASQGINKYSIMSLSDALYSLSKNYFIQEYIDGYECEVPIFYSHGQCFAMSPVGISFPSDAKMDIVSENDSLNNNYNFYNLSDVFEVNVCERIMCDAEKVSKLMEFETYSRIDFRIDKKTHCHYLMDISTTPYVTKHSSFAFIVNKTGGEYSDIFRLIIDSSLYRNNIYKDKN